MKLNEYIKRNNYTQAAFIVEIERETDTRQYYRHQSPWQQCHEKILEAAPFDWGMMAPVAIKRDALQRRVHGRNDRFC